MSRARDRAVARVAAGQRAIITVAQLAACGLGKDAIAYRVQCGHLQPLFKGVYAVGCGELPQLAREHAALLACGERTFLSHWTAASMWGMSKTAPAVVDVSVVGRRCSARLGIRLHQIKQVDRRELRREQGLPVSAPARVLLEIAAVASRRELASVVDEGLARRLLTRREIDEVLTRNRRRRGAGRLAELLADDTATAVTRSWTEKRLLGLIRDAGLPLPETNVKVGRFEVDFMWRAERLVVELDSYGFHSGPGVFQRDRDKALFLRDAGCDVMRLTWDHVKNRPVMVVARIAQELARR